MESAGATFGKAEIVAGEVGEVLDECKRLKLATSKEVLDEVEKLVKDETKESAGEKRTAVADRNVAIRAFVAERRKPVEPVKPVERI